MENPRDQIRATLASLFHTKHFQDQSAAISRLFTADAVLHHPYLSARSNRNILTAYQLISLAIVPDSFRVHRVTEESSSSDISHQQHHTLLVQASFRSRSLLPFPLPLPNFLSSGKVVPLIIQIDLQRSFEGKQAVWRIFQQTDFFPCDPLLLSVPLIGSLYRCIALRPFIVQICRALQVALLPALYLLINTPWTIVSLALGLLDRIFWTVMNSFGFVKCSHQC